MTFFKKMLTHKMPKTDSFSKLLKTSRIFPQLTYFRRKTFYYPFCLSNGDLFSFKHLLPNQSKQVFYCFWSLLTSCYQLL